MRKALQWTALVVVTSFLVSVLLVHLQTSHAARQGIFIARGRPHPPCCLGNGPERTAADALEAAQDTFQEKDRNGTGDIVEDQGDGEGSIRAKGGSEGAESSRHASPFNREKFETHIRRTFRTRARHSILNIAEDSACAVPRPVEACRLPGSQRIHVVFVSAMWHREAHTREETENMLKSILFGTRCRLHIHFIVAGEPEVSAIGAMMAAARAVHVEPVPSPLVAGTPVAALSKEAQSGYKQDPEEGALGRTAVLYSLHFISAEWVLERAKGLLMYPLDHHAGVPGMSKFFLPEILWQVKQAVFLDVDMVLAGDIQDLHAFLGEMERDPELLYFMSDNHPEGRRGQRVPRGPRWLRPFCSCQMLLHLERMRAANMSQLFLSTLNGHRPRELPEYSADGDQFLFMRTCKAKRVCRILPRMWNVSGCTKPIPFLGLSARGKEANGSCWRVVHFNCLGHNGGLHEPYRVPPEWEEAIHWTSSMSLSGATQHRSTAR